jgi:macrolide-specific efflux system membrane fusion protein
MRKRVLRGTVAAVLLLAAGAGTGWAGARRSSALNSPALSGYETAVVTRRDIGATVLATGVVRARVGAQVAVGSRASGILQKLHVTVGDRVAAGQLLAQLDPVEFQTQVARAEAQRASAAAERAYAEVEFERVQQLAQSDAATAAQLSALRRSVETARAREAEAGAALAAAHTQLGYTSIRAPINGVVATVSTQEGETVAASFAAPTFVTIVDLSRLEVWAYVDETDVGRIRVGQPARFTVATYPDETFAGRVTAIRPTAEVRDNVVNYVTIIEVRHRPDRLLRPEMTTTVNIELAGRSSTLSLPNAALRRDTDGTYVLAPSAQGLERRAVQVGLRGAEFSELLGGMDAGERVVLGPAQPCAAPAPERSP